MADITNTGELAGKKLIDRNGADIGEVEAIYLDRETDQAEFALVKTGMLGRKSTLVPLTGADVDEARVWVDLDKESVKDAPTFDPSEEISSQQEQEVFRHYGLEPPKSAAPATGAPSSAPEAAGRTDAPGPEHPGTHATDAGGATTAPLPAHDTQPQAAPPRDGEVAPAQPVTSDHGEGQPTEPQRPGDDGVQPRLRRYTVTDEVEVKVPIQREEVRVEDPERDAAADDRPGHDAGENQRHDAGENQRHDPVEGQRPEAVEGQPREPAAAPSPAPAEAPPREPVPHAPHDPGQQR